MEPEFAAALLTTVQLMGLLYTHRKCKKRRLTAANTKKRIWVHEMNKQETTHLYSTDLTSLSCTLTGFMSNSINYIY